MKTDKRVKKVSEKKVESSKTEKLIFCAIRVGENLFNRINGHLDTLKKCQGNNYSQNRWVNEAIKTKLDKEIKGNIVSIDKHLGVRIDEKTLEKINQQVKVMKKFNSSYSKQKWLVEALSEKLQEDEQITKKRLQKLIADSKKAAQTTS